MLPEHQRGMSAHALVELATSVALLAGICCRLDAICRGRGTHSRGIAGRAQQPGHSWFCHRLRTHDGAGSRLGIAMLSARLGSKAEGSKVVG